MKRVFILMVLFVMISGVYAEIYPLELVYKDPMIRYELNDLYVLFNDKEFFSHLKNFDLSVGSLEIKNITYNRERFMKFRVYVKDTPTKISIRNMIFDNSDCGSDCRRMSVDYEVNVSNSLYVGNLDNKLKEWYYKDRDKPKNSYYLKTNFSGAYNSETYNYIYIEVMPINMYEIDEKNITESLKEIFGKYSESLKNVYYWMKEEQNNFVVNEENGKYRVYGGYILSREGYLDKGAFVTNYRENAKYKFFEISGVGVFDEIYEYEGNVYHKPYKINVKTGWIAYPLEKEDKVKEMKEKIISDFILFVKTMKNDEYEGVSKKADMNNNYIYIWSPDISGKHIYFNDENYEHSDLYWKMLEGEVEEEKLVEKVNKKEFEIKPENINCKVLNTGYSSKKGKGIKHYCYFNVKIKYKGYNKEGKVIDEDKIDKNDIYAGVYLAENIVLGNKSQLKVYSDGFVSYVNESYGKIRVNSDYMGIGVESKGNMYKGIYIPYEYVELYLVDEKGKRISNKLFGKVEIVNGGPEIDLIKPVIEIQDGYETAFSFKIKDINSKEVECKIELIGDFGCLKDSKNGDCKKYYYDDCEVDKRYSFRFKNKKMGNFDTAKELKILENFMYKGQMKNLESLGYDLFMFGVESKVDDRLKELEELKEGNSLVYQMFGNEQIGALKRIEEYKKALNVLRKANDIKDYSKKIVGLKPIYDGTFEIVDFVNKDQSKKGWVEWGADVGVTGITFVQTGVGVLTTLPGKIPIVGKYLDKLSGKAGVAFNYATNVWKTNLQYISKVEKINRAKEITIPFVVKIEVKDDTEFRDMAYQYIMVKVDLLE